MTVTETISNVWILTMESNADGSLKPPFQGDIEITEAKITAVVAKQYSTEPQQIALPGLVNAHGHAAMCLFRGYGDDIALMSWLKDKIWPVEDKLSAADVYWGTLLAITEMLKSGTTTFADMYFFCAEIAQAVTESGIRASLARGLMPGAEADNKIAEALDFALQYRQAADGRITTMLGPHAPYTCDQGFLTVVAEKARAQQIPLHIHLAETQDEIAQIQKREGCRPVEFLQRCDFFTGNKVLAAHCVWLDSAEIGLLKDYDLSVAHNPVSNLKLASGIAPVTEMLQGGLNVALGTDGASSNNSLDLFEEIKLAALLAKGRDLNPVAVPAAAALKMATINGAKALGLEEQIGSLTVGKQADIILVNLDAAHFYPRHDLVSHLAYAARGADIDTVMVAGQTLLKGRHLQTIDEAEIKLQAEQIAKRLCY